MEYQSQLSTIRRPYLSLDSPGVQCFPPNGIQRQRFPITSGPCYARIEARLLTNVSLLRPLLPKLALPISETLAVTRIKTPRTATLGLKELDLIRNSCCKRPIRTPPISPAHTPRPLPSIWQHDCSESVRFLPSWCLQNAGKNVRRSVGILLLDRISLALHESK